MLLPTVTNAFYCKKQYFLNNVFKGCRMTCFYTSMLWYSGGALYSLSLTSYSDGKAHAAVHRARVTEGILGLHFTVHNPWPQRIS